MKEFEQKMNELNEKINAIDMKLEELDERKRQREESVNIGMISVLDGMVHIELLMDKDLFEEEDMEELKDVANKLQNILLKIQDKMEGK